MRHLFFTIMVICYSNTLLAQVPQPSIDAMKAYMAAEIAGGYVCAHFSCCRVPWYVMEDFQSNRIDNPLSIDYVSDQLTYYYNIPSGQKCFGCYVKEIEVSTDLSPDSVAMALSSGFERIATQIKQIKSITKEMLPSLRVEVTQYLNGLYFSFPEKLHVQTSHIKVTPFYNVAQIRPITSYQPLLQSQSAKLHNVIVPKLSGTNRPTREPTAGSGYETEPSPATTASVTKPNVSVLAPSHSTEGQSTAAWGWVAILFAALLAMFLRQLNFSRKLQAHNDEVAAQFEEIRNSIDNEKYKH